MGDLAVTVCLNGILVDNRVIPVHSVVRIGESADAVVHFPGADVAVVRLGKRLAMRGRSLDEGEEMEISLGATHVHLRHTTKFRPPSALQATIDARFLVAAVLVMVMGSWVDAAEYWLDHQPRDEGAAPITQLLQVFEAVQNGSPGPMNTAMTPSDGLLDPDGEATTKDPVSLDKPDGPKHIPDDQQTGTGYSEWYRSVVLSTTRSRTPPCSSSATPMTRPPGRSSRWMPTAAMTSRAPPGTTSGSSITSPPTAPPGSASPAPRSAWASTRAR